MPTKVRYVCVDCHRTGTGGPDTRWCDRCGGELRPVKFGPSRKRKPVNG